MTDNPVEFGRVLITGGGGFIGRHLAAALAPRSTGIVVASRSPGPAACARGVRSDLTRPGAVRQLLQEFMPTTVFNLAGRRPTRATEEPGAVLELNLRAAIELVRESSHLGVRRVILVGSAEEYGEQAMPVSEDAPLKPLTPYGASKAAMTLQALELHQATNAPVAVVRPFSVYGPGAPQSMFVAEAAACAARGAPFQMTDGMQRRDLIYVTDVVEGLLAAARAHDAVGKVFNLGSGTSHSMRDVAQTLWRISGTSAELQIGARPRLTGDVMETRANIDRARCILGWEPQVGLDEGLQSTWLAARARNTGEI